MIGVFDSGVGGLNSFSELRRLLPDENLIYLSDSKHAPYGTKSKEALKKIVTENINTLSSMGASRVLIACCTASAIYDELDEKTKALSMPIIHTAAEAIIHTVPSGGAVAVVATEFTAKSGAFGNKIHGLNPNIRVYEIPAQVLVSIVELGAKDGELLPREEEILDEICSEIMKICPQALVLGCTHFSSLKNEFAKRLKDVCIINTARLGARRLAMECAKGKKEEQTD